MVSLSIPSDTDGVFKQLAVVRIDATTGDVASVEQQGLPKKGQGDKPNKDQKEP
ncbi:MAG: hypothetical protein QOI10_416 [Solirubrobacterales bacterium]|nr:hypothetical protein [Solirubrobacterales bacterium]